MFSQSTKHYHLLCQFVIDICLYVVPHEDPGSQVWMFTFATSNFNFAETSWWTILTKEADNYIVEN